MFVKAFGRIPSRHPGYCDKKSRGSAAAMLIIWVEDGHFSPKDKKCDVHQQFLSRT